MEPFFFFYPVSNFHMISKENKKSKNFSGFAEK